MGKYMIKLVIMVFAVNLLFVPAMDTKAAGVVNGEWNLDENTGTAISDASGNSNNGTLLGGASWTSGIRGSAINLDGIDGYASIPDSSTLDGMSTLTVSAWVKLAALPVGNTFVVRKGSSYRIAITSTGQGHLAVGTTNNGMYTAGTTALFNKPLSLNTWHHIVGTYDGTYVRVYVDGVFQGIGTQAISGTISDTTSEVGLGSAPDPNYLKGAIDEVNIYSVALSATEVQSLYSSYLPVGEWNLNENTGTAISDASGNSNNGTLLGGASWTSGIRGSAINLDGIDGYASIPDSSTLDGMSTLTVSAWVKLAALPVGNTFVVRKGSSYRIAITSTGQGHLAVGTTNNGMYTAGTTALFNKPLSLNTWHHIVGTYDGTYVRVYVDSVLQGIGTQTISGTISDTTSEVGLGSAPDPNYLKGAIDEVNIYSGALSTTEVQSLYHSYFPTLAIGDVNGEWNLDENAGTAISDASGNSNNGTLLGGATWTSGIRRSAINLDGIDGYASIPDSSTLDGMGTLTVSAWVKLAALPAADTVLVSKEHSYRIAITNTGQGQFAVQTTNDGWYTAGTIASFTTALSLNTWYHIVGTYDGTHVKVYVNGALQGTGTQAISGTISDTTSEVALGTAAGLSYLKGAIDEAKIYSGALSAAEVASLYSSYTFVPAAAPTPTPWASPVPDYLVFTHNVLDYGAVANNDTVDNTTAFQNAIDACFNDGGGIVYVPTGQYKFNGHLVVKEHVVLRGEWTSPDAGGLGGGTILKVYENKDNPDGSTFLALKTGAGVRDMSFYYPEQDPLSIHAYPYTIGAVFATAVKNITLINSYNGIENGLISRSGGLFEARDVYGTVLNLGIDLNIGADFSYLMGIKLSPWYWENSLLPNYPDTTAKKDAVRKYMYQNGRAFVFGYNDTVVLANLYVEGYRYGLHFAKYIDNPNADSVPARKESYGSGYGLEIVNCDEAVRADFIGGAGLMFSASKFHGVNRAIHNLSTQHANSSVGTLDYPILLNKTELSASAFDGIAVESSSSWSRIIIQNSQFTNWGSYAVKGDFGDVTIEGSNFQANKIGEIYLGTALNGGIVKGNTFNGTADIVNRSRETQIDNSSYPFQQMNDDAYSLALDRRPGTSTIINVKNAPYNAAGDGTTDDTLAFQNALNALSPAGGTVFAPAGEYHINGTLNIPANVELRGVGDLVARPVNVYSGSPPTVIGDKVGTTLKAYSGEGSETGTPFITLNQNSGVRGISILYPARDSISTTIAFPPTIKGVASGAYVMYMQLVNPYIGVLMDTADNHLIKRVNVGSDHLGIKIVNGTNGVIEAVEQHAQFWGLVPTRWGMPDFTTIPARTAAVTTSFVMDSTANETIFSANQWSNYNFMTISGSDSLHQASVRMINSNSDSAKQYTLSIGANVSSLEGINFQSLGSTRSLYTDPAFNGVVKLFTNTIREGWIEQNGTGTVTLQGSHLFRQWDYTGSNRIKVVNNSGTLNMENNAASMLDAIPITAGTVKLVGNIDHTGAVIHAAGGTLTKASNLLSGSNMAIGAVVTASTANPNPVYALTKVNDGEAPNTFMGWASSGAMPQWLELNLGVNKEFRRIELYMTNGYSIKDYKLQYYDGAWHDIVAVTGNTNAHNTYTFNPVVGSKVRVWGTLGPDIQPAYLRVTEVEVYNY